MGKVTCLVIPGLELWFNSNDHLPPHFHVERGDEWEARVYFLREAEEMVEVKWGAGPSGKSRRTLVEAVQACRLQLLEEWTCKVRGNNDEGGMS